MFKADRKPDVDFFYFILNNMVGDNNKWNIVRFIISKKYLLLQANS